MLSSMAEAVLCSTLTIFRVVDRSTLDRPHAAAFGVRWDCPDSIACEQRSISDQTHL